MRPGNQTNAAMSQRDEVAGRLNHRIPVIGRNHMIGIIQHGRSHAHIFAVHLFAQAREGIYFRNRRQ